jgi:hypothetical protein
MTTSDITAILTVSTTAITAVCMALRRADISELLAEALRQRARERLDRERRWRLQAALKNTPAGTAVREEAADGSTLTIHCYAQREDRHPW